MHACNITQRSHEMRDRSLAFNEHGEPNRPGGRDRNIGALAVGEILHLFVSIRESPALIMLNTLNCKSQFGASYEDAPQQAAAILVGNIDLACQLP
jgi:hypothetical protein